MNWVDLHTHIVYDVDDGSEDMATSLAIISALVKLGFSDICATPHQKASQYLPDLELCASRFAELQTAVQASMQGAGTPELHLGAENMWDDVFVERFRARTIPSYNRGKAFLVELTGFQIPTNFVEALFESRMRGELPVLAHPERYVRLVQNLEMAEKASIQAPFVIDAAALAGHHGESAMAAARTLMDEGFVHALATDSHRELDVAHAAEGIEWARKRFGDRALTRWMSDNPRMILGGEHPD